MTSTSGTPKVVERSIALAMGAGVTAKEVSVEDFIARIDRPLPACAECGLEIGFTELEDLGITQPGPLAFTGFWGEVLCRDCYIGPYGTKGDDAEPLLIDMTEAIELAAEPITYAIEPIAARGFLTVLAGRHSSYKSWLMLATGHTAHCGGGEISDLRCNRATVLYVDAENGARLMGRRFKDAGIPANGLFVADGTRLRLPRDMDLLRQLIEETGPGLVVLDSLRRLTPGIRENESDDMAALVADLGTIAREFNAAVVLIHHRSTKKGAADLRRSSAIEDQADLVFALERVDGDRDQWRRRLRTVKYRIDVEPEPIWLHMGMVGDRFTVRTAEPYEPGPGRPPRERDRLRGDVLAELDGKPRLQSEIAKALGRHPGDGTVRRVLQDLDAEESAEQGPDG